MLRALIVQAHPEAASFCAAQMRGAARTLEAQGYEVEISDLNAQGWNAGLGRKDFIHAQGGHFHIHNGMLRFAGYTVLASVVGDDERAQLGRVREAFTGLDDRAKVFG